MGRVGKVDRLGKNRLNLNVRTVSAIELPVQASDLVGFDKQKMTVRLISSHVVARKFC